MLEPKAIIFDLGRVLVDLDPSRPKFADLMRSMGIDPAEAFHKYRAAPEVRRHMTGKLESRNFYDAIRRRFRLTLEYPEFVEAWCDLFKPIPGMRELFERAAKHLTVGILSDTDPLHWQCLLERAPWLRQAARPTLSHEVGQLKPHPDMFNRAAANCGAARERCLFIDDLAVNVDGARRCGMMALPFTGEKRLRADLAGLGIELD